MAEKKKITKPTKRTRFAIYTRYSSEMQNDLSLEAQEARCRKAIAEREGYPIGWGRFLKYALPAMIIVVAMSWILLIVRYT